MNAAMNFEKTRKNSPRLNEDEVEALRVRKGKRNKVAKQQRVEWETE